NVETLLPGNVPGSGRKPLFPFLLILFTVLVFAPSLPYGFLTDWDDHAFIVENPLLVPTLAHIRTLLTSTFQDLYTPLPMLSFMADKALFGLNPVAFRAENLFWHILSALFLYGILRELHFRDIPAFVAALLWAIHPQKAESVVWITERKDVLCGAFFFASLFFFLRSLRREKVPVAATLCGLLALASKPAALPLPGIMIVSAICLYGRKRPLAAYGKVLLLPLLAYCGMILYSFFVTAKGFPGGMENRFLVVFHNLFWYPVTALLPFELNPMYPNLKEWARRSFFLVPGVSGTFLVLFFLYRSIAVKRIFWTFFFVTGGCMIPVLGFLNYTAMDFCDRYNYLVSACVLAFVLSGVENGLFRHPEKRKTVYFLLFLYAAVFALRTFTYLPVWKNCDELFTYAVRNGRPANHAALENGVMSAVKSSNASLLREFAYLMRSDHDAFFPQDEHLLHTALFLTAHADLVEGKREEAFSHYLALAQLIMKGELDLMRPKEFLPVLMRGGAETSLLANSPASALFFFREYFKVKKEHSREYFYMREKYRALLETLKKRPREQGKNNAI
ncbi:MAG: hypothetical protein J6A21_02300, partial [Lentisphaeria bacterium]|nr:hypothetical protein [Lentisphaeria bacterium]